MYGLVVAGTAKEAQRQDYGDEYREMTHTETDWLDRLARQIGERDGGGGRREKREERGVAGGYPSDVAVSAGSSVMAGMRKREKLTEP